MMKSMIPVCVVAAVIAAAPLAFGQSAAVSSALKAMKVEQIGNKTLVSPAESAKPGDIVEYRAVYANKGNGPAKQLFATVPIPANTTLVLGSIDPDKAQGSFDGVSFSELPLTRAVKQADGSLRSEAVPLSEYRALRWSVGDLSAGQQIGVSLRVRINPVLVSAAPRKL
jgi:uncharacterized repeat protein (TIGR01451 family)